MCNSIFSPFFVVKSYKIICKILIYSNRLIVFLGSDKKVLCIGSKHVFIRVLRHVELCVYFMLNLQIVLLAKVWSWKYSLV